MRNIVITGAAGYVGSVLTRQLLYDPDNHLILVDKGMYGLDSLKDIEGSYHIYDTTVKSFVCNYLKHMGNEVFAIIHLSGLSNDPLADFDLNANMELNYHDTQFVADACIVHNIPRFIYASSASVYGMNDDSMVTESSRLDPASNYSQSKWKSECYINGLAEKYDNFRPVIFRKGTIMGSSPRMRFDLVVNTMIMNAIRFKEIRLFGGGENWRPLINVIDVARAYKMFIDMKDEKYMCCSGTYNLVHKNYRISELGLWLGHLFGGTVRVVPDYNVPRDVRSYRLCSNKIEMATGFKTQLGLQFTYEDIMKWIQDHNPDFDDPIHSNIKFIKQCQRYAKIMKIDFDLTK